MKELSKVVYYSTAIQCKGGGGVGGQVEDGFSLLYEGYLSSVGNKDLQNL